MAYFTYVLPYTKPDNYIFLHLKFRTRATYAPHPRTTCAPRQRKFSVQRSHVFKVAKFLNLLFSYRKYSYEIYEILQPTNISHYQVLCSILRLRTTSGGQQILYSLGLTIRTLQVPTVGTLNMRLSNSAAKINFKMQ